MVDSPLCLALKLAYKGTDFSGFARQNGQATIQGELEQALQLLFRRPVQSVCAGRTDAGVHARGQVISFEIQENELRTRSLDNLCKSIQSLTHPDIIPLKLSCVPAHFSARFSAISREYRYFICTQSQPPLYLKDFSWYYPHELNIDAMRAASKYLVGEHDFKSFCLAASAKGKRTKRYVEEISLTTNEIMGDTYLCITVIGNAFLHSMVRSIVGTLIKVGREKKKPEWMLEVLESCNRCAAGENAPACGLTLWKVNYPCIL